MGNPEMDGVDCMADELKRLKAEIRSAVRKGFKALSDDERENLSNLICQRVLKLLRSIGASTVMLYAPMGDEVDVEPLARQLLKGGVKVCLPQTDIASGRLIPRIISSLDEQVAVGAYGIREPKEGCQTVPLSEIDAVIVPGRAFDERCGRIGRGGGYYDRFLRCLPSKACAIGVAFEFQVFKSVPMDEGDVFVDCIVTERRVIVSERFARRFGELPLPDND